MESTLTQIYGYRAGSTLGQLASAPILFYAEDATFYYTVLGKEKRVQSYFIISRNNSNLMRLRRIRTHLGITWESFWNKTGNVDQSDPPDFQTKMKKKKRHCLIRAQNSQVNFCENLHKNFHSTSYASFVLILNRILILSEWEEIKKGFLKETWGNKKFLTENSVMWKLMWFY